MSNQARSVCPVPYPTFTMWWFHQLWWFRLFWQPAIGLLYWLLHNYLYCLFFICTINFFFFFFFFTPVFVCLWLEPVFTVFRFFMFSRVLCLGCTASDRGRTSYFGSFLYKTTCAACFLPWKNPVLSSLLNTLRTGLKDLRCTIGKK